MLGSILKKMDYINKNHEEVYKWLKENLSKDRFKHSIGAARMAKELAKDFKLDEEKAYLAGLLHDCAKCFDKDKLLELVKTLDVDESELMNYKTHHAPVSAYIARTEFGVEDEGILSAIRWHTLGRVGMSDFEKIVFLADKIEVNTRDIDFSNKILKILRKPDGLNNALLVCYKETIKSLVRRDLKICQATIDIYNSLQV